MKRTCTTLITGPDPLILSTFRGNARANRSQGPIFDLRTAEQVGSVRLEPGTRLTPDLYAEQSRKYATAEYPAIEWQR